MSAQAATTALAEGRKAVRMLVAEDDAFCRRFLARTLAQWGYEVTFAVDGDQAWEILNRPDAPRMALLDWMMPGTDGLEVCRKLRRTRGRRSTYILIISASGETADIVAAMNAGADDFVVKSYDVRELEVRLRAARRIVELEDALWTLATRDPLTRLWNRGAIMDVLQRELSRCCRHSHSIAVIMADIDHFKQVNDTYGHKGGDAAIQEVAERLRGDLRSYDTAGRYGGEEFLIVLPEPIATDAAHVAERLRRRICQTPFDIEGGSLEVTMSFGVAMGTKAADLEAEKLIRSADSALYEAKQAGRNCVRSA